MANEPFDYTSGNGFGQGLQLAGLYDQVQVQRAQAEAAKAQAAELAKFRQDWQSSFGDPEKMTALVAKYPGQIESIKQGIGFQDEQHQMALGNAARDLRVAMASGNPQAIGAAASRNAGVLGTIGSSPEDILQQYQQDPQSLANVVDAVGLSALGPKDYYGVTGDRAKLAEQVRSNQAGEALQARGQDITIRGQNISASNSAADRDIKRLILEQQVISNKLGQAKTEAEIQKLNLQLQDNNRQQQDVQQQKQMSYGYAQEASQLARNLSTNPDLGQATGTINTMTPVVRESTQDVLNTASRLQSLLTQDNLKLMSGVLTDRDITFLGNIASGLNITDTGIKGSEGTVRKRLVSIADKIDSKLKQQGQIQAPVVQTSAPPAQQQTQGSGNLSSLWGD